MNRKKTFIVRGGLLFSIGISLFITTSWAVNFKSTYIYPITKQTVDIINGSKNLQEAQDKLCGKNFISSGFLLKNNGAVCKMSPHSAMISLALCEGYKNFEVSECAKGAKAFLWGKDAASKPLRDLIPQKITQSIIVMPKGEDKFTNEFSNTNEGTPRSFWEELQFYANPQKITAEKLAGFESTNLRYLLCESKRDNLPQGLKTLANETCYTKLRAPARPMSQVPQSTLQGAGMGQLPAQQPLDQGAALSDYGKGNDTALKDLTVGKRVPARPTSQVPQSTLQGAGMGQLPAQQPLGQGAALSDYDKGNDTALKDLTVGKRVPARPMSQIPQGVGKESPILGNDNNLEGAPKMGIGNQKPIAQDPALSEYDTGPAAALYKLLVEMEVMEVDADQIVQMKQFDKVRDKANKLLQNLDDLEAIVSDKTVLEESEEEKALYVELVNNLYGKISNLATKIYDSLDESSQQQLINRLANLQISFDPATNRFQRDVVSSKPPVPSRPKWMAPTK